MTHAAPNPGGFDPFFRQRKEEQIAESRRGAGEPNPGEHDGPAESGDVGELVPEGPFSLDRLRAHHDARNVREVAADLARLLDLTRDQIRETGKGPSRQRVRTAFPRYESTMELPLAEAAEFLGVAPGRVADVRRTLAKDGGLAPADRHQALKDVDSLRARLVAPGQSTMDELLAFVPRLAVLEVDGGPLVRPLVRAGFAALATFALRDSSHAAEPGIWHRRLVEDLPRAEGPGRDAVLAVRRCAARVVTLPLDWAEKERYWTLVAEPEGPQALTPPFPRKQFPGQGATA